LLNFNSSDQTPPNGVSSTLHQHAALPHRWGHRPGPLYHRRRYLYVDGR
jgi:hypothetical protein